MDTVLTLQLLFLIKQPKNNSICVAAEMIISRLLWATYRRLELLPIRRTTTIETEIRHENFQNFGRRVRRDRRDFLTRTIHLNMTPTIDHLQVERNFCLFDCVSENNGVIDYSPILPGTISNCSPSLMNSGDCTSSDILFH